MDVVELCGGYFEVGFSVMVSWISLFKVVKFIRNNLIVDGKENKGIRFVYYVFTDYFIVAKISGFRCWRRYRWVLILSVKRELYKFIFLGFEV